MKRSLTRLVLVAALALTSCGRKELIDIPSKLTPVLKATDGDIVGGVRFEKTNQGVTYPYNQDFNELDVMMRVVICGLGSNLIAGKLIHDENHAWIAYEENGVTCVELIEVNPTNIEPIE